MAIISIHALLTESDLLCLQQMLDCKQFQSTLSSRRATLELEQDGKSIQISIHALLTESDHHHARGNLRLRDFNPRSPHGERPSSCTRQPPTTGFQSTLSSRRATSPDELKAFITKISIHALLTESDRSTIRWGDVYSQFQSTLSSRRATISAPDLDEVDDISIHALLTESDAKTAAETAQTAAISIHALLTESDYLRVGGTDTGPRISIHALLTESDFIIIRIAPRVLVFQSTLSSRRATYQNWTD